MAGFAGVNKIAGKVFEHTTSGLWAPVAVSAQRLIVIVVIKIKRFYKVAKCGKLRQRSDMPASVGQAQNSHMRWTKNKGQANIMEKLKEKYGEKNPDIGVAINNYTTWNMHQRVAISKKILGTKIS